MKYLLKNGTFVSGDQMKKADVLIENEKIAKTGPDLNDPEAVVIDVTGKLLFPGFIDAHTHFQLEVAGTVTADNFDTGTRAAIKGGTTTVIDFATQYKGETLEKALENWHMRADGRSSCDYSFHMAISDWNEQTAESMEHMMEEGITSFKLYMTYQDMILNDHDIFMALRKMKEIGGITGVHCENAGMIDALTEGFVPDALAELHRSYQGLSFDLKAAGNSEVVRQVLGHEVDFGLLLDPIRGLDLQVIAFAEIPLGVAMPNNHPLAAKNVVSLRDTLQYGLILPAAPLIVHQHVEVLLQKQGIDCARLIRTNDSRMLRSLVKKGVGVGLLSWLDAHADIQNGELRFARIENKELKPMVLSLCVASHRQLSKAAQAALEVLRVKVDGLEAIYRLGSD